MKGIAELKQPIQSTKKKYLAEMVGLSPDDAMGMMSTVYWTGHGDNVNFFGLNSAYKGQKGSDLYEKMSNRFKEIGEIQTLPHAEISDIYWCDPRSKFKWAILCSRKIQSICSNNKSRKSIQKHLHQNPWIITFATGQFKLDENAKTIIDLQFRDIAKSFCKHQGKHWRQYRQCWIGSDK